MSGSGLMFRSTGIIDYVSVPDNIWGVREWYRKNASTSSEIDIVDINKDIDEEDMIVYTSCVYDCESGLNRTMLNRGFNRICFGDVLVIVSRSLTPSISDGVVKDDPISVEHIQSMVETFVLGIDSFLEDKCEWILGVMGLFPFIQEVYIEGGESKFYCNNIDLNSGESIFNLDTGGKPLGGMEIDLLTKKHKTRSLRDRQGWVHGYSEEVSTRLGQDIYISSDDSSTEEISAALGKDVDKDSHFCVIS